MRRTLTRAALSVSPWRAAAGLWLGLVMLIGGCAVGPMSTSQRSSHAQIQARGPAIPGSLSGERFFVAFGPMKASIMSGWKVEGFTAAYKLIGDFDWSKVEPSPGQFDFSAWKNDAALLQSEGIAAFPSLEFLYPPAWFIAAYPDALQQFPAAAYPSGVVGPELNAHCEGCRKDQPSISLAWLEEQAANHTAAWTQFTAYVTACLNAMASDPSVIGVSIPWMAFHGSEILGGWVAEQTTPSSVYLGTFNPAALATWPGPGSPPATLTALEAGGTSLENEWQSWTQQIEGKAFLQIADMIQQADPSYWIAVDKFVWIRQGQTDSVFALTEGLTETAFNDFYVYVQKFVSQTGDHRIVLDDDGLMDPSKIPNYALTMSLIRPLGLQFMGESQPGPSGITGLLQSVQTLHPNAVVFLPAPGGGGKWVLSAPAATKILCLVKTTYRSETCTL